MYRDIYVALQDGFRYSDCFSGAGRGADMNVAVPVVASTPQVAQELCHQRSQELG